MKLTEKLFRSLPIVLLVTLLTACGGLSSGGSNTPGENVVATCSNGATNYPTCTPKPAFTSLFFAPIAALIDKDASIPISAKYTGNVTAFKSTIVAKCNQIEVKATLAPWVTTANSSSSSLTILTPYGGDCTADLSVIASGPDGDSLPSTASISWKVKNAPVLHYTEKVYAKWTGNYPFAVTKTGVTKVLNKTQYQEGARPLFNCLLADKPLADGKVLVACQNSVATAQSQANTLHLLYIDPTKDELYEYNNKSQVWDPTCGWCAMGSLEVPTGVTWKDSGDNNQQAGWGKSVHVADGWYFTPYETLWVVKFKSLTTGEVTTIKEGTFKDNGSVTLLISYTN